MNMKTPWNGATYDLVKSGLPRTLLPIGSPRPPRQATVSFPWDCLLLLVWGLTDQPHQPPPLNHTQQRQSLRVAGLWLRSLCRGPSGDLLWSLSACCAPGTSHLSPSLWPQLSLGFTKSPPARLVIPRPVLHPALVLGTSHEPHLEEASLLCSTKPTRPRLLLEGPADPTCLCGSRARGAFGLVRVALQRFPRHQVRVRPPHPTCLPLRG